MSAGARWTIAIFSFFCGVSFIYISAIGGIPNAVGGCVLGGFCILISIACVSAMLGPLAARIIGVVVLLACCGYLYSEIANPRPVLHDGKYRRADANGLNASLALLVFGLPAGYVALTGKFPKWTQLGDKLHNNDGPRYSGRR